MVAMQRLICAGADLEEGGRGVRFSVELGGRQAEAFAVRFEGTVRAFLNECGHIPAQLDWRPGEFFDDSKLYLICSVHGALYAPDTGACLGGRCAGRGLQPLPVREIENLVYLNDDESHD
jgi:nitrite reductase/ring-hydroxylating ferredoxin subunit